MQFLILSVFDETKYYLFLRFLRHIRSVHEGEGHEMNSRYHSKMSSHIITPMLIVHNRNRK